jgi:hypothetical protein
MAVSPALKQWPGFREEAKREVYLWRREQFSELGFNRQEAIELAYSDADLGQARYLLGSGCSPEVALRILR